MAFGLLLPRKRGRLAALLVPEPPIPSPDPLRPRLALDHPPPEPLPDPALADLCRHPCHLAFKFGPGSGRERADDAFSDAEASRGEEEARDGHYRCELVQDAEGDDERGERGNFASRMYAQT
uniref:Carbonic anhydrase ) n=1 Tax=Ganoderma boninense TaxID=34458 RepID=A0A5K1K1L8_9APHY|nr:Carbonic anhydrase (EC (Carbonate dehydratase) [Ganoderma boninense]